MNLREAIRSHDPSLTDDEVEACHTRIVNAFKPQPVSSGMQPQAARPDLTEGRQRVEGLDR